MALAGAPVLLKQGYLQSKNMWGWKREFYRLLQDSLFKFATHDSKIPLDEFTLTDGSVEDASWETKTANMLRVQTAENKTVFFVCENSSEHRQWFDALYYATTLSRLAEYCSPLSGGWLKLKEGNNFVKRWFVVKDSFLLCYHSREDMNKLRAGAKTKRKFVLPLVGAMLAYYKSPEPYSFAIQLRQHGEMSGEFVMAATSQTVMNVWMEVLYVSMGNELPQFKEETDRVAVPLTTKLTSLTAGETPMPSKSHRSQTIGKGVEYTKEVHEEGDVDELNEPWENHPGRPDDPHLIDGLHAPPAANLNADAAGFAGTFGSMLPGSGAAPDRMSNLNGDGGPGHRDSAQTRGDSEEEAEGGGKQGGHDSEGWNPLSLWGLSAPSGPLDWFSQKS